MKSDHRSVCCCTLVTLADVAIYFICRDFPVQVQSWSSWDSGNVNIAVLWTAKCSYNLTILKIPTYQVLAANVSISVILADVAVEKSLSQVLWEVSTDICDPTEGLSSYSDFRTPLSSTDSFFFIHVLLLSLKICLGHYLLMVLIADLLLKATIWIH